MVADDVPTIVDESADLRQQRRLGQPQLRANARMRTSRHPLDSNTPNRVSGVATPRFSLMPRGVAA